MNNKTIGQQYHNCFIFNPNKKGHNISREELSLNHIVLTDYARPAPPDKKLRKIPLFMAHKRQKTVTRPPTNIFTNKGIIQAITTAEIPSERPFKRINSNTKTQQTHRRSTIDHTTPTPFNFTRPKTARRHHSQTIQTLAKLPLYTPNKSQTPAAGKSYPSERPIYRRTISAWSRPTTLVPPKQEPLYFSAWETDPAEQEQYL